MDKIIIKDKPITIPPCFQNLSEEAVKMFPVQVINGTTNPTYSNLDEAAKDFDLNKLCGIMYGELEDNTPAFRFETWDMYELMSN